MNVIRLNQNGTLDFVKIKKSEYERFCIDTVKSIANWATPTMLENFDLVYDDASEPIEELINHNAEKLEPTAWQKCKYHAYIGDCVVVKTKPFYYKNGLVGDRVVSCTKEDFELVKNFLNNN